MKAENIIVMLSKVFLWERLMVSWEEHSYVESDRMHHLLKYYVLDVGV